MVHHLKIIAAVILFSLLFPAVALSQSQPPCKDRLAVLETLATKYQEAPVAVGVANSGGLVELLSSQDGGTWTIIVTIPGGHSCLVAAGEGWRSLEYKLNGPET